MANPWSGAAIAELRRLWDSDLSASRIAAELNRQFQDRTYTRNAVIGYSHRLPLPDRAKSGRNTRRMAVPQAPRIAAVRTPKAQPAHKPPAPAPKAPSVQPAPIPAPMPTGPSYGLTLDEVQEAGGCRWAISERPFRFCGSPGQPYCTHHAEKSRSKDQKPGKRISTNRNSRFTS